MNDIISKQNIEKTVVIKNGKEMVRSDNLAKMFERTHKQVLALIREKRKFMEENNISLREYFVEERGNKPQGGSYLRYYLTRKGFDYIALALRGKKAELYKLWYIDAFHDKQRVIEEHKLTSKLNKTDDLWLQFREEGKVFRNKLTKAIHDTVITYRNEHEKKMNDGRYFQNYTRMIYKKLGIELPKGANPRDVLDKRMLVRLEDLEDKVADLMYEYSKEMYYKDVYQKIRESI